MLQFEGGLSVTALVISGAYHLAKVSGKAPPITKEQANKFAEYFVNRRFNTFPTVKFDLMNILISVYFFNRSVPSIKGAHCLLETASVLSDNPFHIPVALTLASRSSVSKSEPKVTVRVTDILGNDLEAVNVIADSATRLLDDAVVVSQKQLTPIDE